MQAKLKRLDAKREEAEQELNPPQLIEYQADMELPPMAIEQPEVRIETASTVQAQPLNVLQIVKRPHFKSTIEKYTWLMKNKRSWDTSDATFLMKYVDGHQYFDMLQIYAFDDINWTKTDDETAKNLIREEEPENWERLAIQ